MGLATVAVAALAAEDHAREEVAHHTAHVLRWGEVMVGTSGIGVGALPRVQISTKPLFDALGLWTGGVRVGALDFDAVDAAVTGHGTVSSMQGLKLGVWGVGAVTSVALWRAELHAGLGYTHVHAEGLPTGPAWIVGDTFEQAAAELGTLGIAPVVRGGITNVRAAGELRVVGPLSVLAQFGHGFTTVSATLDPAAVSDALAELSPALGLEPVWTTSVSLQLALGAVHLRGGFGASNVPFGWAAQANAAHVRIGQHRGERRPVGEVGDVDAGDDSAPDPAATDVDVADGEGGQH